MGRLRVQHPEHLEISPTVIDGPCFDARDASFEGALRILVRHLQAREAIVVADVVDAEFALDDSEAETRRRPTAFPPLSADRRPCTTAVRRRVSGG